MLYTKLVHNGEVEKMADKETGNLLESLGRNRERERGFAFDLTAAGLRVEEIKKRKRPVDKRIPATSLNLD